MRPADVFVGRDELIDELGTSFTPDAAVVGDVSGVFGIGKTALLRRLQAVLREQEVEPCIVLHTDAADFDPRTDGPELSDEALSRTYREFLNLLNVVAVQIGEHGPSERRAAETFDRALRASLGEHRLFNVQVQVTQNMTLGDHARLGSAQNTDMTLRADGPDRVRLESSQLLLAQDFAGMINGISPTRRVLWTIDSFDAVAGQEMGRWLLSLAGSLRNTLVVLGRAPVERAPQLSAAVLRRPLSRLSREQTRLVLATSLADPALAEEVVDRVYEFTSGHPLTVAMTVDLHQSVGTQAEFDRLLAELPADKAEKHAEMALSIVREAQVNGLESVLEACAITPGFDADTLAALMAGDAAVSPRKAIETFRQLTFIEELDFEGGGAYRVHAFIANALRRRLQATDVARFRELHSRAAAHHFKWLEEYDEEKPRTSYAGWYRYEDPVWQARQRVWLFHESQVVRASPDGPRKETARRRLRSLFVHEFMDAFWWWGYYMPFPYNHELIDGWVRSQDDLGSWLDALRTVLAVYPTGYDKARPAEVWMAVEDALLCVLEWCALDVDVEKLGDDEDRHTRAVVELFLAHTYRYREVADRDRDEAYSFACGHYSTALDLFERIDDAWNRAWTLFERADTHAEFGRTGEAGADWNASVGVVLSPDEPLDDEELVANLHRLRGDLQVGADPLAAFRSYGRAVGHAYEFQNRPHEPDLYTAAFYTEMLERTTARLRALGDEEEQAEAAAAAREWLDAPALDADALRAALASADDAGLASLLFPAGPAEDEILAPESEFLRRWRRTHKRSGKLLGGDLATDRAVSR